MPRPRVKLPVLASARDLAGVQAALSPFHGEDTVVLEQMRGRLARERDARLVDVIGSIDRELDLRVAA